MSLTSSRPTLTPTAPSCAVDTSSKASAADREMFLGLLFPADEHRLYGYVTSTNIKFVLVVSQLLYAIRVRSAC
jgi:hypothetical protein